MITTYPVGYSSELSRHGLPADTRFVMTHEFRCPCAGEWYLSGAIPEAYYAYTDRVVLYHILRPLPKLPAEHPHYKPT